MKKIRIGCGQGFWGDSLDAPVQLVRQGPLDYLILDYLAEVTMSILARHKQKNPDAGYARDFVELLAQILDDVIDKKVCVLANAGGVNPESCARAVAALAEKRGKKKHVRIAVVQGDDLIERLNELEQNGETLQNLDDSRAFSAIRSQVRSANAYLGAGPLVQALQGGANIVITGRVADPSLALAPMIHTLGWKESDWNMLAAGIVAGHIIECGAQCTGGNCSVDWQQIPDLAHIGYPVVEIAEDGTFVVTKHPGTGGRINLPTVKEQIVYEIGDPRSYITPDAVADFTSIRLSDAGAERVQVSGVKGRAKPETLKVSMSYSNGHMAAGTLIYSWPDACRKARAAGEIIKKRIADLGLPFDAVRTEIIGANACHGQMSDVDLPNIPEVMLRAAVRAQDKRAVERFAREIAPLVLNGPPSATAYFGRPQVQEVIAYWPTLVSRANVIPQVTFL